MLEGVAVILRVIVELIRVGEEIAAGTEGITAAHIRTRQTDTLGLLNREDILRTAVKRLADLVADIGVRVLVRHDLHGVLHARGAMIGGEHERITPLGRQPQQFIDRRVTEPTERQTAVRRLVVRQLTHHLTLRTRVREHVDEIEHDDIQGRLRAFELLDDAFAEIALVDLPIVKTLAAAIAVQQRLDKFFLMLVLTLFVSFFDPKVREHLLYLKQKDLLDQFLKRGAITQKQHDKSLYDFSVKMGEKI